MSHSKRRALIILYYWPPAGGGGVQRWLKFTRYMPDMGWEPIVFAPENADYPLSDPSLVDDIPKDVEVIRFPIREIRRLYKRLTGQKNKGSDADNLFYQDRSRLGLMKRLALFVRSNVFIPDARSSWIKPSVSFLAKWLQENPVDLIISTGPPHSCHIIAYRLKQLTGLPWVADFRDPWTDIEFFEQLSLTESSRRKHFELQEKVMRTADRVVTVSPSWARLFEQYGAVDPMVITNGFDPADVENVRARRDPDKFVIAHVGTLELDRSPASLWESLDTLIKGSELNGRSLELRFSGKVDSGILDSMPGEIASKVVLPGYLSHEDALVEMQRADVLLLLQNMTSENNTQGRIPGKVFEYMSTHRPILMLGDPSSDLGNLLSTFGMHGIFSFDDREGIMAYLQTVMATQHIATEGVELAKYTRQNLTRDLVAELNQLIGNHH